jgi:retron-type reverse transcriptase
MAAPFRDRVMHHALVAAIEPIFERGFIHDSYACRVGKGTHRAVARLRQFMRRSDYAATYIFQGDISKYFDSIDHEVLFGLIEKKVDDLPTRRLIRPIIDSAHADTGVGIPIGNLTSQLFANIYLNELDQFVKHTLHATRYIRYMDDFSILETDKRVLANYREAIEHFVAERLHLRLHPRKSTIAPIRLGIDFLGYRLFEHHTRLRASTVKRFVKRTKQAKRHVAAGELSQEAFDAGVTSWQAYADYADSWRLRKALGIRLGVDLLNGH